MISHVIAGIILSCRGGGGAVGGGVNWSNREVVGSWGTYYNWGYVIKSGIALELVYRTLHQIRSCESWSIMFYFSHSQSYCLIF